MDIHSETKSTVFDYRLLRFFIGFIAFALPIVVTIVASRDLSSISASYYTDGRDWFVGMLFIVGSFLLAYNGHSLKEEVASKLAAFAAFGVALFPTSCKDTYLVKLVSSNDFRTSLELCADSVSAFNPVLILSLDSSIAPAHWYRPCTNS